MKQYLLVNIGLLSLLASSLVGAELPYIQQQNWQESITASRLASTTGAGSNTVFQVTETSMQLPSFWQELHQTFPNNGPVIMAARDWMRQDKLDLAMTDSQFAPKVNEHLEWTEKTLEYVKKAGGDISPMEAEFKKLQKRSSLPKSDFLEIYFDLRLLRRRIIFSHPALDFEQIVINVNPPTTYSHNGDQFLARHSRTGKGLTLLSDWKSDEVKVAPLLAGKMPQGAYRDPDLNFDADRILFAFSDHTQKDRKFRRYFIYEAALDGSWVKQLTGTSSDPLKTWENRATVLIEDNDPCYLPDGNIAFLSTRSQSYGRCHGGRYNPAWVLHRSNADGSNIQQLSFGNENECEPSVLNDGRIAFTRWEYTDRHEMYFHKLWWCRPDGSSIAHLFGNDMIAPMQFVEVSAIPDSHKIVATALGHHSFNTGTIVVIDPNIADNGEEAISHITPETPYSETRGWPSPHYSHPYPVTEELFLVSRASHSVPRQGRRPPAADRGIYLVDPLGGRELIYEDPEMASFSPIAIRKRKRPGTPAPLPKIAPPEEKTYGTVFLQNAYLTRNDPEGIIKPGMIKAIRVNALGVQPRARRTSISSFAPNNIPKKVLGTVPVDKDGSAFFRVPARTSLQIQTLDENGMAILTERSFFYLQPGENRSCIGCHEPYGTTPDMGSMSKMGKMKLMDLKPPAGPQYKGGFSFIRTVQPVLDRYCISCHGLGSSDEPKAKSIDLTNGPEKKGYTRPYRHLAAMGNPKAGDKRSMGGLERNISRPRDYYAHRNRLPHMLLKNHGDCNMDKESFMRIVEWLDMNSPFYGDMFPNKQEWRKLTSNTAPETLALRAYIKESFGDTIASQPLHTLINKVQVDESRILMAPLASPAGGWGQLKPQWPDKNDSGYAKMVSLVEACILKSENENTSGWEPTIKQGAGEPWIIEARKAFKKTLQK